MDEEMTIEYLPLEVLEEIATYLSAVDLTHCLLVSQAWYNTFSNDYLWKKRCTKNVSEYLSTTKCLAEPSFTPSSETPLPIQNYRQKFLQEKHLWKNWDSGHFNKEEIVFGNDDEISYNIEISFFDNDHVCLHKTKETEVWNVLETPFLVMTIPYCLKGIWLNNVYKVVEDNLIVVQCNVVQVYRISLDSKSWSLNRVFFFNKPEEFSSAITAETDVDGLFQEEPNDRENEFERVICGQYLVGACICEDVESPILHVWSIETGKRVKDNFRNDFRGKFYICRDDFSSKFDIKLNGVPGVADIAIVTFTFRVELTYSCSIVYDLSQLKLVLPTVHHHSSTVRYFSDCLAVLNFPNLVVTRHYIGATRDETVFDFRRLPDILQFVTSVQVAGENLLMCNGKEVFLINACEMNIPNPDKMDFMKVDFHLSHLEVLCGKYLLLHNKNNQNLQEIWRMGKCLKRVMAFPTDMSTFVSMNNACSKIVLQSKDKLTILNFW